MGHIGRESLFLRSAHIGINHVEGKAKVRTNHDESPGCCDMKLKSYNFYVKAKVDSLNTHGL